MEEEIEEKISSSETIIIIPRIEGNEILLFRYCIPSLFLPRRYTRNFDDYVNYFN